MPSTRVTAEQAPRAPLLSLERLSVTFATPAGAVEAVRAVSLAVAPGECLAVVGESGAGKSQLFLAALGLLPATAQVSGSACFNGCELLGQPARALDRVRGAGIGMVFQDPLTSLTPHLTVGAQLCEVIRAHAPRARHAAAARALALLQRVHLPDAEQRLGQYPYELSGGMRQRVGIALALAGDPQLLIADEPTTALDVTVQAQILALLLELRASSGLALVLISHDLGVVAGLAERVLVMRAGRVVESGAVGALLAAPHDPYTQELVRAARALGDAPAPPPPCAGGAPELLALEQVAVRFARRAGLRGAPLAALSDVSLALRAGEALGIVGESGAGKSTLARAALALLRPAAGRVVWLGREPQLLPRAQLRALRRDVQLIFQDPLGSLDPRLTVGEIIAEPLAVHGEPEAPGARVNAELLRVGLDPQLSQRYPHQLSGGQCQRVGLARALVLKPRVLVCDEPLSSLDMQTQEQMVQLLGALRAEHALSLLFISHNLALVRRLCARVLVLYLGRMMELAPAAALYERPLHPYTRELLAAIPSTDPQVEPGRLRQVRPGEAPSPQSPPSGCVYRTRCAYALPLCAERVPVWEDSGAGRALACLRWRELP
jgi:peptide/nickel transport system ATP-binding protein